MKKYIAIFIITLIPQLSWSAAPVCSEVLNAASRIQFLRSWPEKKNPKIGVYFGTFDPIHEGHVQTVKNAMAQAHLDMVLFVPNRSTLHKPNANEIGPRMDILKIRLQNEPNMNLLVRDGGLVARGGRGQLFSRLISLLQPSEIFQIIGQDSYDSQRSSKKIHPDLAWKVLVAPRGDEPLRVPEKLQSVVTPIEAEDSGLSSTMIRNMIKSGDDIPEDVLSPEVQSYIHENGLYGASPASN